VQELREETWTGPTATIHAYAEALRRLRYIDCPFAEDRSEHRKQVG
jgi:hypothetical protein